MQGRASMIAAFNAQQLPTRAIVDDLGAFQSDTLLSGPGIIA
jgi:hypothetical protein